jgi:hypothetical protein
MIMLFYFQFSNFNTAIQMAIVKKALENLNHFDSGSIQIQPSHTAATVPYSQAKQTLQLIVCSNQLSATLTSNYDIVWTILMLHVNMYQT